MSQVVIVFDFDETIIDCDSDVWIANDLGGATLFNDLLKSMPWNAAAIRMMEELHAQGRSLDEVERSLKTIPLSPHTISAIKSAHALGYDLRILSDANTFFIETVLKHHGIIDCFTEIYTNPSCVDEERKLIISPYHDSAVSSHGCSLCPPNLCKGNVIERIRDSPSNKERICFIYIGDGKGDYCPSLKLRTEDIVMPRKDYPLWRLIHGNMHAIEAEIHGWSNAFELKQLLLQQLSIEPDSTLVDSDDSQKLISPNNNTTGMATFQFLVSRV
ncbi:Pyridoxal phosphate phosphatase-related protein [Rhynchospora pubera]|uniref:Pyridoxal phosphate phosphatase-related protein n=1 Tax=Rhynchospora pubera TaxID=906938 RepID=A0AAV8FUA7_9POAL|nr:Pyridoxal phosphate phosphatase-related protein [Rhynchospora pubera]